MANRGAAAKPPGFLQRPDGEARVQSAIFPRAERPARAWQATSIATPLGAEEPDELATAEAQAQAAHDAAQAQIAAVFTGKLGAALERLREGTLQQADEAGTGHAEVGFLS